MKPDEPRKTALQRALERVYGGRDIRLVIQDLYRRHGRMDAVAEELGISRGALDLWIADLGGSLSKDIQFAGVQSLDSEPAGVAA